MINEDNDISKAEIVIGAGYGIRNKKNFNNILRLAEAIQDCVTPSVAVGGTRKAINVGILDGPWEIIDDSYQKNTDSNVRNALAERIYKRSKSEPEDLFQ